MKPGVRVGALLVPALLGVVGLPPSSVAGELDCPPTGSFSDDFEPGATAGWTVDTDVNLNPGSQNWQVVEYPFAHSPTNVFFSDATGLDVKDDRLVSPPQDLSSTSQLIFWHWFALEISTPAPLVGWFDGGVLEVSTNGGVTWQDVGKDNFVIGGYYYRIATYGGSRIAGRFAWSSYTHSDEPGPYNPDHDLVQVIVNVGDFAGSDVMVRWRLVQDPLVVEEPPPFGRESLPGEGWWIDDVQFTNLAMNCPPVAADDSVSVRAGFPVRINVLANDSDANGDSLSVTSVTDPPHGSAVVNADNTVTYDPDGCFVGTDTFNYTISDGNGGTDTGVVSVTLRKTSRRSSIGC